MSRTSQAAASRQNLGRGTPAAAAAADAEHEASLAIEHRFTSAAVAGVNKPPGVPASVFEAGLLAGQAAKPRKPTVLIDLASIVVETGVPLPGRALRATTQAYETLLAKLVPGTSVLLPTTQAKTLQVAARKRGYNVVGRQVDDQRSRVWSLPKDSAVATGASSAASNAANNAASSAASSAAALTPVTGASK